MNRAPVWPLFSQADASNSHWYGKNLISHLVQSRNSGGELSVIEGFGETGGESPLHRHSREDEFLYVFEGDGVFESGGARARFRTGSFIWLPRATEHCVEFYTDETRLLAGYTPGAYEGWYLGFSTPAEADTFEQPCRSSVFTDVNRLLQRATEFGVQFLPRAVAPSRPNPTARSLAFASHAADATPLCLPGMKLRFLAPSRQTSGVMTAFESEVEPGVSIPLHTKGNVEFSYVLEGEARFQIDGTLVEAGPGVSFTVPKGVEYGFRAIGRRPCKVLRCVVGGQYDRFVASIQLFFKGDGQSYSRLAGVAGRYGITVLAPEIED